MKNTYPYLFPALLFLLFLILFTPLSAQNLQTGFNVGSVGGDLGSAIAKDASGNLYIAGMLSGPADFDPSGTTFPLTSAGSTDIFLVKYNAGGALVWAFSLGSTAGDYASSVAVDAAGDVYIAGRFEGTVDFDPDVPTFNLTSFGATDAFVAKYNSSGAFQWANQIGGTSTDEAMSLCVVGSSRVMVTGFFSVTADFDPGAGTATLTSAGNQDMFIAQYRAADGGYRLAQGFGDTSFDYGLSIVADASGNVYVGGIFGGTVDFDPGAGVASYTATNAVDAFVASYDGSGGYRWGFGFGGNGFLGEEVRGLALGSSGELYITGRFQGAAVDFDPSAATATLASNSFQDIFLAQYSQAAGKYQWAFNLGGAPFDIHSGWAVHTNGNGEVFISGGFGGTVDFDPGVGTANKTSAGASDIFLAKYDKNGTYQWALSMGDTNGDEGRAIVSDGTSVFMTGGFNGSPDFDPFAAGKTLTSAGSTDMFFTQYSASPLPVEWEYIEVSDRPEGALLEWKTAMEVNNDFFAIQRSIDGSFFEYVGALGSYGDSQTGHYYAYLDEDAYLGTSYYRLKQVDTDGAFSFSDRVELSRSTHTFAWEISPNPVNTYLQYRLLGLSGSASQAELSLYDGLGHEIWRESVANTRTGRINVQNWAPGIYIMRIYHEGNNYQQRILIQP